ncbi:MAG: tRNA (N(6)-L-threonylcarbamoyladenosine(37)-C(2))-methylthiotransferase [Candidatus Heimdallarchaeaceae archaeon]
MNDKRIYREVYGCSANVADYEIASGLLERNGFKLVNNENQSDLNILFTCVVKTPTSNRMIHRIKELTKLNKPLIVAGCMPKTEKEVIEKINPKASLLGPDSIEKVVDVVNATLSGKKIVILKDLRKPKICLPRIRKNPVIHICEISTGCLSNCSYCEVKYARGKLFSYPTDLIAEEIRQSLKDGCKEIWLTSQDCGCWGRDFNSNLPQLLDKISKIDGKFFIRIGMMNPLHTKDIVDELIDSYKSEKIFKFLHLPVQSGSDRILEKMNRGYRVRDFIEIVRRFREEFSSMTLWTDVIVGFPGETEEDFKKTIALIKKIKPDVVNISKFGPRPGTEAAKMKQLPSELINKRSKKLTKVVKKIQLKKNEGWVGWEGEVLIDEVNKNFIGRNFAYKPIILKEGKLGKFKRIKITHSSSTSLFGYNP